MREFLVLDDEVRESSRCGMCGRPLEDPRSRERGFGPVCYVKAWQQALFAVDPAVEGSEQTVYHEYLQQSVLMEGEDG